MKAPRIGFRPARSACVYDKLLNLQLGWGVCGVSALRYAICRRAAVRKALVNHPISRQLSQPFQIESAALYQKPSLPRNGTSSRGARDAPRTVDTVPAASSLRGAGKRTTKSNSVGHFLPPAVHGALFRLCCYRATHIPRRDCEAIGEALRARRDR